MATGANARILVNGEPLAELTSLDRNLEGGSRIMKGIEGVIGLSKATPMVRHTATYKIITADVDSFYNTCVEGSWIDVQSSFGPKASITPCIITSVKESQATDGDAEGTIELEGPAELLEG